MLNINQRNFLIKISLIRKKIEINLNPEISNKQTVFKYNVLINDVENVLLIRDINTFLSTSFKLYKKMMDSFINEEDLEFNEIVDELDMPRCSIQLINN